MRSNLWLLIGAVSGAIGVAIGAYGAHGLENMLRATLDDAERLRLSLDQWETGARYHMYHALALLIVGLVGDGRPSRWIHAAGAAMAIGTLLFSGCLYLHVLGGPRPLVHLVPIGGVAYIAGWVLLAIASTRRNEPSGPRSD